MIKDLMNTFSKSDTSISYLGVSDDEVMIKLIQLAESYLSNIEGLQDLSKKVPLLIVESFQNITRHGSHLEEDANKNLEKSFFQINFFKDRVIIYAVNKIDQDNVALLDKKIDHLNQLDNEELKELWRATLNRGQLSSKGGAGLGLIEMARKSTTAIKKKFVPVNDSVSTFFMGIEIIQKDGLETSDFDISKLEKQYNLYLKNEVLLQYKGGFNEEINKSLIQILESNFINLDKLVSCKVENLTMIIEILQNISKHGMQVEQFKDGILSIFESNGYRYLSCGNYIDASGYESFKTALEHIKSLSIPEITAKRNKIMFEEKLSEDGNGGLGLLEVALFTQNKFNYSFHLMPNGHYFYMIEVKLKNNE